MKTKDKKSSPTIRFIFWSVIALMALWIILLGGNSFYNTWKLQRKVQLLQRQTSFLQAQNDSLAKENERLKTDPETAEKAAREKFGLTKENETVFRFVPAKEDETKK
ncbi:MAG: septum formation initiator family protein [Candidatus Cloacimonetes bacterium]|nr:septum formation initiator family protein [Candidatus Cloacimonadota bacterium]